MAGDQPDRSGSSALGAGSAADEAPAGRLLARSAASRLNQLVPNTQTVVVVVPLIGGGQARVACTVPAGALTATCSQTFRGLPLPGEPASLEVDGAAVAVGPVHTVTFLTVLSPQLPTPGPPRPRRQPLPVLPPPPPIILPPPPAPILIPVPPSQGETRPPATSTPQLGDESDQ
jgi:hypothetical protein